jgi:hypothetical protein
MTKFFTLARKNSRWIFIDPEGNPFWSLGMNHIDPATLRYLESGDIWNTRYSNSMQTWLGQVRADLLDWGFNSVGWVQEVVTINPENHRHSRSFTFEEYQWLDMPYCHLLPFAETHQWEIETRQPDFTRRGFEEWCDYVARDHCTRMRDDPKLIGYFYTDCPMWVHTARDNEWKGPLFDPERLHSETGRRELFDLATRYYRVTHEAIRRYDPNHLILGDRYEANAPLPEIVIDAAMAYVDVLSFQCFDTPEKVHEKLARWATYSHRPVLIADSAQRQPVSDSSWPAHSDRENDPHAHGRVLRMLTEIPECVGYHLCGAYLKNRTRRSGLRDHRDIPAEEIIDGIREQNKCILDWIKSIELEGDE